VEASNLNLLIR